MNTNVTLCKWSEVLTEMTKWKFQSTNVIGKTGTGIQFTKDHFQITGNIKNIPGKYAKFRVNFGSFDMKTGISKENVLVEYLKNFTSAPAGVSPATFKEAVPLLIKATLENTDMTK